MKNKTTTRTTTGSRKSIAPAGWLLLLLLMASPGTSWAQNKMKVALADGRTILLPLDSIASIGVQPVVPPSLAQLEGRWRLIASANGTVGAGGIHTATTDTIAFTATVAPDGQGLLCHADRFHTRSGNAYPAEWRTLVEEDPAGRIRLGWVLTTQQPASPSEFSEPQEQYLEGGTFYWGTADDPHHYIYLLSENIDTQRLEGMTLWSAWQLPTATATYAFPQNQEVYGVVATAIPYQPSTAVGYIDIWASPRFQRLP